MTQNVADEITHQILHSKPNSKGHNIMPSKRVSADLNSGTYFEAGRGLQPRPERLVRAHNLP